jgi:hypothetical protein
MSVHVNIYLSHIVVIPETNTGYSLNKLCFDYNCGLQIKKEN